MGGSDRGQRPVRLVAFPFPVCPVNFLIIYSFYFPHPPVPAPRGLTRIGQKGAGCGVPLRYAGCHLAGQAQVHRGGLRTAASA